MGSDAGTSSKKPEHYKIGLIILQDNDNSKERPQPHVAGSVSGAELGNFGPTAVLRLQFYLILTSSNLIFPRQTLDRGVLMSRTKSTG